MRDLMGMMKKAGELQEKMAELQEELQADRGRPAVPAAAWSRSR